MFNVGDKVTSPSFGEGIITKVEENSIIVKLENGAEIQADIQSTSFVKVDKNSMVEKLGNIRGQPDIQSTDFTQCNNLTLQSEQLKNFSNTSTNQFDINNTDIDNGINDIDEKKPLSFQKGVFIIIAIVFALIGFAGIICCNSGELETIHVSAPLLIIGFIGLMLNGIAYIFYNKYSAEGRHKAEELRRKQEKAAELEEWKRTHIKKAVIVATRVGTDSGSAIMRGVVGDALAGPSGAVIGTATAKQKQFTTFLLVYEDDTRETKEVENGSSLYQTYVNYIEV